MRFWNPKSGTYEWARNLHLESVEVVKVPLHNGALYQALNNDLGQLLKETPASLAVTAS